MGDALSDEEKKALGAGRLPGDAFNQPPYNPASASAGPPPEPNLGPGDLREFRVVTPVEDIDLGPGVPRNEQSPFAREGAARRANPDLGNSIISPVQGFEYADVSPAPEDDGYAFGEYSPDYVDGFHPAVDLQVPTGTPVQAPRPMLIQKMQYADDPAAEIPGLGNAVWLQDDSGRTYLFAHLATIDIEPGVRWLYTGESFGTTGNTGNSTGPHLHFEVRAPDGTPIDPQTLIRPPGAGGAASGGLISSLLARAPLDLKQQGLLRRSPLIGRP